MMEGMAQPWKGDRKQVATRLVRPRAEEIEAKARALGMTTSEYVAAVLLRDLGYEDAAATKQEELNLKTA